MGGSAHEEVKKVGSRRIIFLGGTCGKNNWRESFTAQLIAQAGVSAGDIFNPVVAEWNPAAQATEEEAKRIASFMIFYLADPQQEGLPISAYSMVEATMALYDKPEATVVVYDNTGMEGHALKQMEQACAVHKVRFPSSNIFNGTVGALGFFTSEFKKELN